MTTNTPRPRSLRAPIPGRRGWGMITGLAVAVAALLAGGGVADAVSPRSDAQHLAAAADDAVEAFNRWERTADPIDLADYTDHRRAAATAIAEEFDVDESQLRRAWRKASLNEQHALLAAITQLGTGYRSLGNSPDSGFDCSGLTSWAYSQADVEIPRTSGGQIGDTARLGQDELFAGALVHYPGHVGLYVGAGLFVHSPYSGSTVEITTLPERSLSFGEFS